MLRSPSDLALNGSQESLCVCCKVNKAVGVKEIEKQGALPFLWSVCPECFGDSNPDHFSQDICPLILEKICEKIIDG